MALMCSIEKSDGRTDSAVFNVTIVTGH